MKKGIILLLIAAFLLPVLNVLAQDKKPTEEKMVIIKGNEDWKNVKVRLYPKDVLIIKASGKVYFAGDIQVGCVDADGWDVNKYVDDWPDSYSYCFDPLPDVNHAALIGNVGSDDFFIGKENRITGKDGFLYLRVNDCSLTEKYVYNTGQFEVYISVVRNKK